MFLSQLYFKKSMFLNNDCTVESPEELFKTYRCQDPTSRDSDLMPGVVCVSEVLKGLCVILVYSQGSDPLL